MNNIKVSIIVPVYNGAEYLQNCYQQLINQTLDDIEIIIIDDGSKDGTAEIGTALAQKNKKCIFYHQENKGAAAARNVGVTKAHGEYIGFVDVDDKYDNDMYELLYNAAIDNNLDIVSSNDNYGSKSELTVLDDKRQILDLFLCKKIHISACFKIFKRSLFPEMVFPEEMKIYEDFMGVYKGIKASSRVGILNVNKYHYVRHEGSGSRARIFNEKYFNMISVVNEITDDVMAYYPDLEDSCNRRKATTYLRISKIYYLRKHPKEFEDRINSLRKWLKSVSFSDARRYFGTFDFIRFCLYLYAFPLFYLLIKTVDKE